MLLQAMVLITTMVVIAGVLLTSTLASAHAAFHEMILAKTQTATNDATARFATWAQDQVIRYGTQQSWPTTPQPTNPDRTVGLAEPSCNNQNISKQACAISATMRWTVTGWSADQINQSRSGSGPSMATNLSTTLHEQRISATITVVLIDPTSSTTYATHSRHVTARIFDAYPYIDITAMKDVSSEELAATSIEGDTAGSPNLRRGSDTASTTPNRQTPAGVVDTRITTTIDCQNSAANNSQTAPLADDNTATYVRLRNVGNQAWVYEAPCRPAYADRINAASAPLDYHAALGNVYSNDSSQPFVAWTKRSDTTRYTR